MSVFGVGYSYMVRLIKKGPLPPEHFTHPTSSAPSEKSTPTQQEPG